jgi:hypothetical protein
MLSIIIFITSFISLDFAVSFLAEMATPLQAMHTLGFILGLGGATAATVLFSKFLRDKDIDANELKTLQMLSELVWLGLALTIISQLAFYVAYTDTLITSASFLLQTLALFVAAVMNAVLMIIFAPFLGMIPFEKKSGKKEKNALASFKRPLFIVGAVALFSWFFAFAMDYVPEYGAIYLFFGYVIFLGAAVFAALLWENKVAQKTRRS